MTITSIYYFFIFVSGCFLGSFLKLVADRTVKEESIVHGRSKCDYCKKPLGPLSLIPVLSYIINGGKCAYCKKHYSVLYPLSEIVTGLLFFGTAYFLDIFDNLNLYSIIYFSFLLVVVSLYIVMIFSDISYYIIPDKVVYFSILFTFGFITLSLVYDLWNLNQQIHANPIGKYLIEAGYLRDQTWYLVKDYLYTLGSAILIGAFFFFLIVITKGKGMGGGDVKLGVLIGLFNGFPYNILGIFLGFVIGSVFSVFLIVLKLKTLKDIIPFGPFLIAGSLVALFFGKQILTWYLGLV